MIRGNFSRSRQKPVCKGLGIQFFESPFGGFHRDYGQKSGQENYGVKKSQNNAGRRKLSQIGNGRNFRRGKRKEPGSGCQAGHQNRESRMSDRMFDRLSLFSMPVEMMKEYHENMNRVPDSDGKNEGREYLRGKFERDPKGRHQADCGEKGENHREKRH